MRVALLLSILVGCKGATKSPPGERIVAQAGDLAIVGATIVPMATEGTLVDRTIVIRGDKILAVAPSATVDTAAAGVIDAKGKWVVPGLADMHVHVQGEADFAMFLANGVTTVRDLFGSPQHLTWRGEIAKGTREGPTMIDAGPILDGEPPTWPGSDVITTPDAARAAVKRQHDAGYDLLKVYDHIPADVYAALVAEAKRQKMMVVGHVPDAVGVEGVIAAGQRTIEHLDGYLPIFGDAGYDPKLVAITTKADVWNCATLVVMDRLSRMDAPESLAATKGLQYVSEVTRSMWKPENDFRLNAWTPETYVKMRAKNAIRRQLVAELARANAKLVLGTDTGNPYVVPGFAVHDELALLVSAGLTPWQALRAATLAPSEMLGQPSAFGAIQVGARADVLVVDRDPLADLTALAEPAIVIVRGKQHARAEFVKQMADATKAVDPFAGLPAIEKEGEVLVEASYAVTINGTAIGAERAIWSKLAAGDKVVRGQASFAMPSKMVFHYRAVPAAVELWMTDRAKDLIVTKREGTKVVAKPTGAAAIELAVDGKAIVAPQTIATFFWHADELAALKIGGKRTLTTAELVVERGTSLEPGHYEYTRVADVDGHAVYELVGTHGKMTMKGRLVVAKDRAPSLVEITVPFGTFAMRRLP